MDIYTCEVNRDTSYRTMKQYHGNLQTVQCMVTLSCG